MENVDLYDKLHSLYSEVLNEFFESKIYNNLGHLINRRLIITDIGITRYNSSNLGGILKPVIEPHLLPMNISNSINGYASVQSLYQFIVDEKLYPYKITSAEEDKFSFPSIYTRYISGLIARMYELSGFTFKFNEENFSQALVELVDFINQDTIKVVSRTNLIGPIGKIDEIRINESITIKKASLLDSQLFCSYYSVNMDVPMYEGDYFIEEITEIKKSESGNIKSNLSKVYSALVLQVPGTIILGNTIRTGEAWPFLNNGPFTTKLNNNYNFAENKFIYNFDDISISDLICTYNSLSSSITDIQINKALGRLQKSKSSPQIEEKLLEMILSVEYLINTQPFEVTYQISLKIIKIFNENNTDESILKSIKNFFQLRGNFIHGSSSIKPDLKTIEIIVFFENILLNIFKRILSEFNKYTLTEINQALDKAIYVNSSIKQLLINQNKDKNSRI